jgi:hypothetical protein
VKPQHGRRSGVHKACEVGHCWGGTTVTAVMLIKSCCHRPGFGRSYSRLQSYGCRA